MLLPLDPELQYLRQAPVPLTKASATPAPQTPKSKFAGRQSVVTYAVQPGDTLWDIASKFGVTATTLSWSNNISDPNSIKPGMELKIPPTSGVLHVVKDGDTLGGLAARYNVALEDIEGFEPNRISNRDALVLGMELTIPGGVKPVEVSGARLAASQPAPPPVAPVAPIASAGQLQWPTYGPIYGSFTAGHRGLDISPPYGTPIYAAESGVVAWVQYINWGYGYHFLVDHGNGVQTMYAHLSEILVEPGERVTRGQHIGRVGTTGRATGPHLHFEVHQSGVAVNPLNFLPR